MRSVLVHAAETFEKGNFAWICERDEQCHNSVGIIQKPGITFMKL